MDLTEIATQSPGIAAILIIVFWNHKAMKNRDCILKELSKDYQNSRDECHKIQRDAIEVMRETSRALGENAAIQREVMTMLRRLNGPK